MLLSVKCLPCYHGDPGSCPTMHMKKARCGCSFLESSGEAETGGFPWLAGLLTGKPASQL